MSEHKRSFAKKSVTRAAVVFVLQMGGRPIVAFEATKTSEAQEIAREQGMRVDLAALRSNGVPLWDGREALTVRGAEESEVAAYRRAVEVADSSTDDMILAYLVEIDGNALN